MSIFQMCLYFVLSLSIVLVTMPFLIQYLKKLSFKQTVSEYALEDDKKKAGTPIMGGILFIIVPVILTLIFVKGIFQDLDTLIVLLAFMGYGVIGFVDDFLIAVLKNNEGLKPLHKFLMQVLLAVVFFVLYRSHASLEITLPITRIVLPLGIAYFFLVLFMFAGSSNAVNLTDGMDGLSSGVSIIALIPYLVITLKQEKIGLAIFVVCLIGALLGYLYYNKKPARVFMGDTGSLALGGVLAALAMITKTE
ncbi:phospho-N-acetylmuramoyl-pentapeptide-transferase, partial [uncultured Solobacterium sp.]